LGQDSISANSWRGQGIFPARSFTIFTVYKYSTFTMAALQADSAYKTTLGKLLLGLALSLMATHTPAKPALWYWWVGNSSEQRICAQVSPGSGWSRENTPFRDSHCSIRVTPF
jgi:hypothetical protein